MDPDPQGHSKYASFSKYYYDKLWRTSSAVAHYTHILKAALQTYKAKKYMKLFKIWPSHFLTPFFL